MLSRALLHIQFYRLHAVHLPQSVNSICQRLGNVFQLFFSEHIAAGSADIIRVQHLPELSQKKMHIRPHLREK